MQRELKRNYFDPNYSTAFTSKTALIKKFGQKYPKNEILDWTKGQDVITKYAGIQTRFKRQPTIVHRKNDIFQMDIADFAKYADKNRNYKYALVVVDGLSRYSWIFKLKSKKPREIIEALQKLFKEAKPRISIFSDKGIIN